MIISFHSTHSSGCRGSRSSDDGMRSGLKCRQDGGGGGGVKSADDSKEEEEELEEKKRRSVSLFACAKIKSEICGPNTPPSC